MRSFAVFALLAAPCAADLPSGITKINDPEYIMLLNTAPKQTWVASSQQFFHGMSFDDARMLLGTTLSHISHHLNRTLDESTYAAIENSSIPKNFDARRHWRGLIHPVRDQQRCASCWAVSAADVLSDRVAIAQRKAFPALSPEDLVSCDGLNRGCEGGALPAAWEYLSNMGVVTEQCMPYMGASRAAMGCATACAVSSEYFERTRASSSYAIAGAVNMQKDIMTHGPIQAALAVYKSFLLYRSGIYQKLWWESTPEGGHAVKILGWGTTKGKHYWLAANSWGATWGDGGCFRIIRGQDSCGIEELGPPYAGVPAKANEGFMVV